MHGKRDIDSELRHEMRDARCEMRESESSAEEEFQTQVRDSTNVRELPACQLWLVRVREICHLGCARAKLERDTRFVGEPLVPERAPGVLARHGPRELDHAPHVAEVACEPQAYPHDAELTAHVLLERGERDVARERRHRVPQAEDRRRPARVAHAACPERDARSRRGVLDECVRHHLPGGLDARVSAVRTCGGQHDATYLEEDERDDGAGVGLLADGPETPCWCPREYPYDRRRCRVVSQRRQRTDEVVHEAGQAEGQEREVGREEAEAVGNRREVQVVDGAVLDESPFELSLSTCVKFCSPRTARAAQRS